MSQANKTISQKLVELSELTAWFEGEDFSLEAALDKYAEAEKLATEIEKDLTQFKNKITVLTKNFSED